MSYRPPVKSRTIKFSYQANNNSFSNDNFDDEIIQVKSTKTNKQISFSSPSPPQTNDKGERNMAFTDDIEDDDPFDPDTLIERMHKVELPSRQRRHSRQLESQEELRKNRLKSIQSIQSGNSFFSESTDIIDEDTNIDTHRSANRKKSLKTGLNKQNNNKLLKEKEPPNDDILTGIFNLNGKSVDLELSNDTIKWNFIRGPSSLNLDKKSKFSRKNKKSSNHIDCQIDLINIYSVDFKRYTPSKKEIQAEAEKRHQTARHSMSGDNNHQKLEPLDDTFVDGFTLHMFECTLPNIYSQKTITFEHPHKETCKMWVDRISRLLPSNY
jgi:hypothetical protein